MGDFVVRQTLKAFKISQGLVKVARRRVRWGSRRTTGPTLADQPGRAKVNVFPSVLARSDQQAN